MIHRSSFDGITRIAILVVLVLAVGPRVRGAEEAGPDLEGRTELMKEVDRRLDEEQWLDAESSLRLFREKYPPTSGVRGWDNGNEVVYLYKPTLWLVEHYEEEGDLSKVHEIYRKALEALDPMIPHYSYRFLAASAPLLLELGKKTAVELRRELDAHRETFERRATIVEHPGRQQLFRDLASRMASAKAHLDLVGKPAHEFQFVRAYNEELPVKLADYRGKVVIIDLWATWCVPCRAAWPGLKELYEELKDDGLEILGITSIIESPGRDKGYPPDRDMELTERLIARHEIPWPILYSDRPVNDPEYAATTLPSYVIINQEGNVEHILVGSFKGLGEHAVRRLLDGGH